ncbi:MAG: ROK family transcriptional regulator [Methyloligellaceae bacterium]
MGHDLNPSVIIRRANRSLVLEVLARHGELGRASLCAATGLTAPGLSRVVRELIDAGLVLEETNNTNKKQVGRPSPLLSINPSGAYVLGITLSLNRLSIALYNAALEKLGQREISNSTVNQPKRVIRSLVKEGKELISEYLQSTNRLAGIGVSIGFPVLEPQLEGGIVTSEALGWRNVPIAELISKSFDLPVKFEPRPVSLLRTEIDLAQRQDEQCVFLINCAVKIGCTGMTGGQLLFKEQDYLIDLMHVACTNSTLHCECGRTGCLGQSSAGVGALQNYMGAEFSDKSSAEYGSLLKDLLNKAQSGDANARRAFRKSGAYMASGVDIISALFSPDAILISGEVGRQPDFVAGLQKKLKQMSGSAAVDRIRVSRATSDQAAANIARHAFVLSRDLDFKRFHFLEQNN